jgi:DNA-binding transcriptional LysR family regulator
MTDRLEEWRIFVTVAQLRSFAQAARTLGRSPQAVTRAVASLEERLRARLLARTTRSVSLTTEGERYLDRGRRVLAEVEALETPVDEHAPLRGIVTVTAPVLFGQLHVAPIVFAFLRENPDVDVRLALFDRVVPLAEEGMDVGVRIGELADSSLRVIKVGEVRTVLCASPAYVERAGRPRSPESLRDHACIAFAGTTPIADRWSFKRAEEGHREKKIAVRPRLSVNTGQAAIDAALAGLGIARVLSYQVDALVASNKLVVLLKSFEPEPVPVQIVQLAGVASRAAMAFVAFVVERLRARL